MTEDDFFKHDWRRLELFTLQIILTRVISITTEDDFFGVSEQGFTVR